MRLVNATSRWGHALRNTVYCTQRCGLMPYAKNEEEQTATFHGSHHNLSAQHTGQIATAATWLLMLKTRQKRDQRTPPARLEFPVCLWVASFLYCLKETLHGRLGAAKTIR